MKKISVNLFVVAVLLLLGSVSAKGADIGVGTYSVSAPSAPNNGLRFYADYNFVTLYGTGSLNVAFDWNGKSSQVSIASITNYPASFSNYSNYMVISTSYLGTGIMGNTIYYNSNGTVLNDYMAEPMDALNIYKCRIDFNNTPSLVSSYLQYNSIDTMLKKSIRHEVGHVCLLKHPLNIYNSSVMLQGEPHERVSSTITTADIGSLRTKWGN